MKFKLVSDSEHRVDYLDEDGRNWYGLLLREDGLPVICGHGGSMWLCRECALKALEKV